MEIETLMYLLCMSAYCLCAFIFVKKFAHHLWSYFLVGLLYIPFFSILAFKLCIPRSFHVLILCCYGLFLFGSVLLVICAVVCWNKFKVFRVFFLTFAAILIAIPLDAFIIEPHWLEVRHEKIVSTKLKKRLKVAIIADLQTDEVGVYEKNALNEVKQFDPDIILFAGDYIQLYDERRSHQVELLNKLLKETDFHPALGAYAVPGDCDQIPNWQACFDGLPVKTFDTNCTIQVGEVTLTVLNLEASRLATYDIPRVERFHIVLGHAPDYALTSPKADLLVAGHTHGGQVQVPFYGPPMMMSGVPRAWGRGCMTDIGNGAMLCISRGVGMERQRAPRLRLLCRPELVFIDVVPQSTK